MRLLMPALRMSMKSAILVLFSILILFRDLPYATAAYKSPYHNFTKPLYPDHRTAIILSGQLRSGNLTWYAVAQNKARLMFGGDDPETPIKTVLEWLIIPYAIFGGVDMFIYIQVDRKHMNSSYGKLFVCSCPGLSCRLTVAF
jgi:hypothetical protein